MNCSRYVRWGLSYSAEYAALGTAGRRYKNQAIWFSTTDLLFKAIL